MQPIILKTFQQTNTPNTYSKTSPYTLIQRGKAHGSKTWDYLNKYRGHDNKKVLIPLMSLAHSIEQHNINLIQLCNIHEKNTTCYTPEQFATYKSLQNFYSQPELHHKQYKHNKASLMNQLITPQKSTSTITKSNPYHLLMSAEYQDETVAPSITPAIAEPVQNDESLWAMDAGVSKLTDTLYQQLNLDRQAAMDAGEDIPTTTSYEQPHVNMTPPTNQRIRFNLIRHRGTVGSSSTLKLFKSFCTTLRNNDQTLTILPYQTSQQHYSSLTNIKQIQAVDENRMNIYFRSFHSRQYYSLSGYFHISSSMTLDTLKSHPAIAEWLDSNRYYLKACSSNSEEMVPIGALCFSSIYINRDDLKVSIQHHPSWIFKNDESPPIFDLHPMDFIGPNKKSKMIFVTSEKSKQQQLSEYFQTLYDGSCKEYPNGAMLLFIPLLENTQLTPEYRNKIIYNHERYLGEEAAICIGGLQDLKNITTLKNGMKIPLRMLLKSIPASQGMSRPQLFHFVEPNSSGMVTLATFNASDKTYIETRKHSLETEIRNLLAEGEEANVFTNPDDGIWFGGVNKSKAGKIIPSQQLSKQMTDHIQRISKKLPSPPKKRQNHDMTTAPAPTGPINTQLKYTITGSTQNTPATPKMQPIITPIDHNKEDSKFNAIAEEFNRQREHNARFDQRISQLETTTNRIDYNINAILSKMDKLDKLDDIHATKHRKMNDNMNIDENIHPDTHQCHPGGISQCVP